MKVIKRLNKLMQMNTLFSLISLMIILFFIFFWFSYIFVFVPSPFGVISSSHSADWLQWIGAFMGGVLGGIFAFIGVRITLEDQRKEIQYENKRKALPFIDINTTNIDMENSNDARYTTIDEGNKYIPLYLCFSHEPKKNHSIPKRRGSVKISIPLGNVGLRELYDLHIGDINSIYFKSEYDYFDKPDYPYKYYHLAPIVYNNRSIPLNFFVYENGFFDVVKTFKEENLYATYDNIISFKCYFRDCYENWYYQKLSISLVHQLKENAFTIDFSGYEIDSSPIEIPQNDLPWENGGKVDYFDKYYSLPFLYLD